MSTSFVQSYNDNAADCYGAGRGPSHVVLVGNRKQVYQYQNPPISQLQQLSAQAAAFHLTHQASLQRSGAEEPRPTLVVCSHKQGYCVSCQADAHWRQQLYNAACQTCLIWFSAICVALSRMLSFCELNSPCTAALHHVCMQCLQSGSVRAEAPDNIGSLPHVLHGLQWVSAMKCVNMVVCIASRSATSQSTVSVL